MTSLDLEERVKELERRLDDHLRFHLKLAEDVATISGEWLKKEKK